MAEWDTDEDAEGGKARVNALAHGDDTRKSSFQEQRRAGAVGEKPQKTGERGI